jgi:hypothetical protein
MLAEIIAIVGAIPGGISLAWLVRNWREDRVDLRLTASAGAQVIVHRFSLRQPKLLPIHPVPAVIVSLANHGRREAHVEYLAAEWSDGTESVLGRSAGAGACSLKEGQCRQVAIDILEFTRSGVNLTGVLAYDGLGRAWPLHHVAFLELQSEMREPLAERMRFESQWSEQEAGLDADVAAAREAGKKGAM